MEQAIIDFINEFGYFGVCLLIMIENIFPPIPSEVILTFGGFLTTVSDMTVLGVIFAATVGSMFGAIILYGVGRVLNAERLERLIDGKIGRTLRLEKEDIQKAERVFEKHGKKAVFFGRFIPLVRSMISVPAGMAKMSIVPFLSLTLIGSLIWNTVLVYLGHRAGNAWEKISPYFDTYSTIAVVIMGIIFMILAGNFIKKRFFTKKQ